MSLQLDEEFSLAVEPLRAILLNSPHYEPHDFEARRCFATQMGERLGSLDQSIPGSDVEIKAFKALAKDGYEVPIYRFALTSKAEDKESRWTPLGWPALLHIHGGGMVMGDVLSNREGIAREVRSIGIPIFSVDYRLAPENQHPTLVEDCYAALSWLHDNASQLDIDQTRIAIFGESAGGGLAAGVALMARDRQLKPPLAKQFLIYPMLDDRNTLPNPALEPFCLWKAADNAAAWRAVLGDAAGTEKVSPYAAPARADDFHHLPPTYMDVGGLDLFRDENLLFAARIAEANVPIEFHLYPGVPHGFENISAGISVTRRALENRKEALTRF